jgi:drug/metabolite transporter (DMT)-like permease
MHQPFVPVSPRHASLGLLLGFVGVAIFAGSLPATHVAVAGLEPLFVTAARPALAGLMAGLVLLLLRRPVPEPAVLGRLAVIALCLVFGFPGLTNFAMRHVGAGHGGVIIGVLPLATAVCGAILLGERPGLGFWASAVAGGALVTAFALRSGGEGIGIGDLLVIAAVVICAVGYAVSGALSRRMPGWEVISWALVLSLPVSLPLTLATWPAAMADVPVSSWLGLAYITVMSQYLGFFAWNTGLALGGVALVSQTQLLQPFLTLAIAATITGEEIDGVTWGFALAVVAVVLAGRRAARRR